MHCLPYRWLPLAMLAAVACRPPQRPADPVVLPPVVVADTPATAVQPVPVADTLRPRPAQKPARRVVPIAGYRVRCGADDLDLEATLGEIVRQLEAAHLAYNVEPFSDCSGIFHRVLDSLALRCPDHAYPDPALYRDSRALARWYHQRGRLVLVQQQAREMDSYIRPGAVMFYSRGGGATTLAELTAPGGIGHVGVVVAVEYDRRGVVSNYALFHGRNPGKPASVTHFHHRRHPRYPPYGNAAEPWVAVAPILGEALAVE
ncbi:MAG: hypothetical protein OHK0039_00190 [Bacteroidia bacterium]